ncbi:efflux RND transporter periplasmic adaptor subunit [Dactylosporangium sp. NPDC049525]|uniref:efflux RND transporter periplasmic adaptor subunit n=1 Tax=Dactylosporangium sp. NPDC049525 TaxID=3154730 RepID=UPI003442E7F2
MAWTLQRRWTVAVAAGALAVTAGAWVWHARGAVAPGDDEVAVKTVEVVRTDLSASHTLRGQLGFGAAQPVKGAGAGVVTWLPAPGTSIGRGDVLLRVDDEPVVLFLGGVPMYRPLHEPNTVGRDVAVVAANLKALGYTTGSQPKTGTVVTQSGVRTGAAASQGPGTAASGPPVRMTVRDGDGVLTAALITAVKAWQRDRGMPADGRLDVGDLVVLPAPVRVDAVTGQAGDAATGPLLSVTPTAKVVTAQAALTDAGGMTAGDAVTVRLPDGTAVPGKVATVGRSATATDGDQQARLTVTVTLDDPAAVDRLDAADVRVEVAGQTRTGVLAVPVGALVALSEGGYALQLPDGRLLPVTTGLFAKGMVEVTGAGLTAGATVVTSS